MALNAKNKEYANNSNRIEQPVLDAGAYPGRIVQVIDLGVQPQRAYKGEEKPPAQEIMVTYEFADEFIVDEEGNPVEDKPRWLSETFPLHNLQSDLAKSTKRYYAADPDGLHDGDWTALIGAPVVINITRDAGTGKNAGKIFNNIASTSSMRKKEADKLPALQNEGKVFDQSDVNTAPILLTLPQWLQDKVKGGLEWDGSPMAKAVAAGPAKAAEKPVENKKAPKKEEPPVEDDEPPFDTDDNDSEDW